MSVPPVSTQRSQALFSTLVFILCIIALMCWFTSKRLPRAEAQTPAVTPLIINTPNPNFRSSGSRKIDTVVIHYMSGINVDRAHWADPKLALSILKRYGVSAHYLVDRVGKIYRLVDERNVAWHAGGSKMPTPDGRHNVNSFSIGIETIATATSGFTAAQYRSLALLIKQMQRRYPIKAIVGHDQIAGIKAVRLGLRKDTKVDPGPLFDWQRLHKLLGK